MVASVLAQARVDTSSFKHAVRVLHVAVGIRGAAQISTDSTGRIIVSARHDDAWVRATLDGASEQWGDAQLSLRSLISGVGNLPSGPLLIEQGSDMVRLAGGGREVLLDGSTFDIRIDTPVFDSSFWTWVNGLGFFEALCVVIPLFEGAPFSIGDRHSRWLAKSGDAHPDSIGKTFPS